MAEAPIAALKSELRRESKSRPLGEQLRSRGVSPKRPDLEAAIPGRDEIALWGQD